MLNNKNWAPLADTVIDKFRSFVLALRYCFPNQDNSEFTSRRITSNVWFVQKRRRLLSVRPILLTLELQRDTFPHCSLPFTQTSVDHPFHSTCLMTRQASCFFLCLPFLLITAIQ